MRWPWQQRRPTEATRRRTEDVVTAALIEVRRLTAELHVLADKIDKATRAGEPDG